MNKIISKSINISKQAAGKHLWWIVGALLCIFLTGCGSADRAMSISFGEPLEATAKTGETSVSASGELVTGTLDAGTSGQGIIGSEEAVVCVYVCGAVQEPGVVTLPAGSRCNDALEAAGGFSEDADRESVNLAEYLSDGMQIYFPTVQEALADKQAAQETEAGLININTAGVELLCTLPGIGEAKAKAIVAYREQNGDFGSAEDIMQVPGIKESAYSQMKDLITVK